MKESYFYGTTLMAVRIDYDGGNYPIYIGEAMAGTLDATVKWRIKKLTWSGTKNTAVEWASGNSNRDKSWDHRKDATYAYS